MNGTDQAREVMPAAPLMICEHCDTVYRRQHLKAGEVARCARCGAVVDRHRRLGPNALLALIATAMVIFIQANIWPIVTLGLGGQVMSTTLWGTIIMMWEEHSQIVAVLAATTLFFFPLTKMCLLGWVLLFARRGERAPGFRIAMLLLHYVGPWTMSEVFMLGTMVAIVKARAYFDVAPNAGIFAYGALMLLITVFAGVDVRQLWDVTRESRA